MEAAQQNVTKPRRLRTHRDAGRERASGAAGRSKRQAEASVKQEQAFELGKLDTRCCD